MTRRIVTGHREDGTPQIVSDGLAPRSHAHVWPPGMVNTVVWKSGSALGGDPTTVLTTVVPTHGETTALVVVFPPDSVLTDPLFDAAAAAVEQREITPGLAELFEPDAPGMHTTPTVDYAVVLDGEIVLDLGTSATTVRRGDVVVQNGTRHAWRNPTDRPATVFFVLVGVASPGEASA